MEKEWVLGGGGEVGGGALKCHIRYRGKEMKKNWEKKKSAHFGRKGQDVGTIEKGEGEDLRVR